MFIVLMPPLKELGWFSSLREAINISALPGLWHAGFQR
jgi:hypothetical protein